jgi:NADH:ubiquinone oxidoreductase subunit 3 (subunit A)
MLYAHIFARRGRNLLYRDFYECGFRMIPDLRFMLDIQFSIIGIIFLIYDMEIVLLTPLAVNILQLPNYAILLTILILSILAISY